MKKQLLLFAMILLPLVASAHDIEVQNAKGVTIYYNFINKFTELEVTFRGTSQHSYSNEYQGNIVIPEEVTYMDKTYKVSSIRTSAFYDCKNLTSITIPNSVTSIGNSAFSGCTNLTTVTIGNSVTSIEGGAFYDCKNLTSITIPNSVTSMGSSVFANCSGLNTVIIGNSVTSIEVNAFSGCTSLTSITIGNSVASIEGYAFQNCKNLTSITIPNSVTSIKGYAFKGVDLSLIISKIENLFTIVGKYSSMYQTFTTNTFNNATLYVPVGTIDKYRTTEGWKDFNNIIEANPTGIKTIENTQIKNNTFYDLNGVRLSEPKKGINIINGKKVVIK